MDPTVERLATPEECDQYIENVEGRFPELATEARRRRLQLLAKSHAGNNEVEQECYAAIFAYEQVLYHQHGKRVRASRTWQMIRKHGVLAAVTRLLERDAETAGYDALAKLGLIEHTFEAVADRHPDYFPAEAVTRARERLAEIGQPRST